MHGLTRVRGLTQDDAHIFCSREQMADELKNLLSFVLDLLRDYGLEDFYLELSTRDETKEKFVGTDEDWEEATAMRAEAASESGLDLVADPGGAAFYGPKISVQAKDAIGRTWQMSTIQVDFQLPKRFGLEYQASDGTRQQPVMIHRALFGSIERFFGVLVEHYAGAFPAWLAPVQVVGIPIAERTCSTWTRWRPSCARRRPGRGRHQRRPDAEEDPQRAAREGAVHADRRRPGRRRRGGVVPVPQRRAAATACRSTRRSPRSSRRSTGACLTVPSAAGPRRTLHPRCRGAPGRRRGARRLPAAVDAAPDGVHPRRERPPATGDDCPFCRIPGLPDDDGLIVARGELVYVVLNLYPYNSGHLMVVPYRHVADYTDLTEPETVELAALTQRAMTVLRAASGAQGFNVGMNQGVVAGAGIAAHLHQHVVPRWGGDTNFMPVVGHTKVLPELLGPTRELLAAAWGASRGVAPQADTAKAP